MANAMQLKELTASRAWHALRQALRGGSPPISTE
ncbi:hypothetical protein PSR1_00112 [Anaeromyxobacter sp. PSR-1]|nr:hypothetical protein PSR1_00112 [Anaeromyxobacter sp. PSR-1]